MKIFSFLVFWILFFNPAHGRDEAPSTRDENEFGVDSTKKQQRKLKKEQKKLEKFLKKSKPDEFTEDLNIYDWNEAEKKNRKGEKDDLKNIPVWDEDKEKAIFYFERAKQKIELADLGSATNFLTKAIRYWPSYKEAYILRAEVYSAQQKFASAIDDYSFIISLDSLNANFFYNKASCNVQLGNHPQAIDDFTSAINLNEEYLLAYQGRGVSRSYLGDQSGAIDDFSAAILIDQDFIPAYKGRALSLYFLGDYNAAIKDFTLLIALKDDSGFAFYYRGLSKIGLGEMIDGCLDLENSALLKFEPALKMLEENCN